MKAESKFFMQVVLMTGAIALGSCLIETSLPISPVRQALAASLLLAADRTAPGAGAAKEDSPAVLPQKNLDDKKAAGRKTPEEVDAALPLRSNPKGFSPSEKIPADQAVDFPADI